jgi:hypothetical protein
MNTTIENSPPPAPVSTPAPAPAAAPMPMAAPPPAAPAPAMAEGGETTSGGGGIRAWFGDINVVEVSVSALIVGVGIYAIQYFRLMMAMEKSAYNDVIERIGKLESAALAAKKTAEVNASGSRGRRPIMRLG